MWSQATVSLYCPLVAMTAKYKPPLNRNKNYCVFFIYVLAIAANLSIILFQNARILRFLSLFFSPLARVNSNPSTLFLVFYLATLVVQNCQIISENNSKPPD